MKLKKIAPSILSADFANLQRDIEMVEKAGAHLIHIDVMDGHFVPNITIGPPVVKSIKRVTKLPLDVHLMITEPEKYIDAFAKAGADYITIHAEATPHLHRVIQQIKSYGIKAGVSLNPHSPLSHLEYVLCDLDLVLIMTVNPGFGGQSFIASSYDKLVQLQRMLKNQQCQSLEVAVDGGVSLSNIKQLSDAGVDIFVAGSAIFKSEDPAKTIKKMIREIS